MNKIIARLLLIIAYVTFGIHIYQSFLIQFDIDIMNKNIYIYNILFGLSNAIFTILILNLISKLKVKVKKNKINIIQLLTYSVIFITFILFGNLLFVSVVLLYPYDYINIDSISKFYLYVLMMSILYAFSIVIFFFATSLSISRKDK